MRSDLRFALRTFRRSPGLIAAAILATALGVGANTAIFSVIQAVLLRPLPYQDAGRLVMVWEKNPIFKGFLAERLPVANRNYVEWKRRAHSFAGLADMQNMNLELTGSGTPEELDAAKVTPDFFPLLGRSAWLGRVFRPEESVAGRDQVVVLSYGLFQRRFAGDSHVLRRSLTLNGRSYSVIGVLPADFHLPALFQGMDVRRPAVWLPRDPESFSAAEENNRINYVFGRLSSGVSLQQARAEMAVIAKGLEQQYKFDRGFSTSVFPLTTEDVSPATGRTVLALQVAVGFVLLIACANVANLLLARAAGRGREIAIRAALGASRLRLVRQALAESVMLSALGGALGLLLAVGAMAAIRSLAPEDNYHFREVGLNWVVLAFGLAVAMASGIFFGVFPALGASASNLQETLAQDGRAGVSRRARRLRNALVVAEVALALVLLAGAGLMAQSLRNVLGVNPGFSAAHVLSFHVKLPDDRYSKGEQFGAFAEQMMSRLRSLGGVESVAVASGLPLMDNLSVQTYAVDGEPAPDQPPETDVKRVSEDYFRTIGTPILRGRGFTLQEASQPPGGVVIVTESLARQIGRGDALGRVLVLGAGGKNNCTVIGIVPDTHEMGLDTPSRPEIFLPSHRIQEMAVLVRTKGDPMALSKSIGGTVQAVDKDQPVIDVKPLEDHLHGTTQQRRFDTGLFVGFAGLALLLAAVGLYGVLSYSVMLRTREIGVRMALGARGGDVVRLILRNGLLLTVVGTLLGGAGAMALTRLMQTLVFGVSASDAPTFGAVAGVLLVVAALASYIPARRASRMDPVRALRVE